MIKVKFPGYILKNESFLKCKCQTADYHRYNRRNINSDSADLRSSLNT